MKQFIRVAVAAFLTVSSFCALAQVSVSEPWIRATVAQQKSTGAFMTLNSKDNATLVAVKSSAAALVELHEMAVEKDIMKMRAISALSLPAGKSVQLRPGGYHVMLIDLKAPLKEGDTVPLSLVVEAADGKRSTIEVKALVRPLTAPAGKSMDHGDKHHGMKH